MVSVFIVAAVVLVALFIALLLWLPSFVMTGSRQTLDEAMQWQTEHYDTSFYQSLQKVDYTIEGFGGYQLHVELLRNPSSTNDYVILSHGYTDNRFGSLKYAQMYLDLGFNCIIYDLRGHGKNEPTFTTYGVLEAKDLVCLIDDTRERYPEAEVFGLHGESLGAATTITSLKYQPKVDFVVADCGFADIENVLREGYKNAGVPEFLVDVADLGARIRYGYAIKDMRPIDSLTRDDVPILFIHGNEDTFILPKNSQDMAATTHGPSEVHLIPGAGHAESILTQPDEYRRYVAEFLGRG